MYVILGVIIIALLLSLSCIYRHNKTIVLEKFTTAGGSMPGKIEDHLCKGDGAFTGVGNLYKEDAVMCVKGQCDQVKCWFMKAVKGEEDVFEFNDDYNHMRIIDRDPVTMQCLSKVNLGNILKTVPVTLKTVDEVVYDSAADKLKNNVEQVPIPDAQYVAFYQQDNITTMQMKRMTFNDLNKPEKDMNVIIDVRGVFDFDEEFICKRAVSGVINNSNMPLTDIIYKRYLKKMRNEDAYEVVYKRIEPKNITLGETMRFQPMPYIHTVGKTKASLKALLRTMCDSDCSKLTDKKFYEKDEDANEYKRVNFVDPISNPKRSIITSETTDCVLDARKPVEDVMINKNEYEYESKDDIYKLSFEYNNPDLWYEGGDPTKKQPVTKDCAVVISEPRKRYPLNDRKNWLYVTDRVCDPCDVTYEHKMPFNIKTLSLDANSTSVEYTYTKLNDFKMKGFAKCSALSIKYTCSVRPDADADSDSDSDSAIIVKTNPMIVMKKKSKELIARHVINEFNKPIEQRFAGSSANTELTFFDAFDIFSNEYDNIVLFVDSGSYSIQLQDVSVTLHCEQADVIENSQCNIFNGNLKECKYETQYYDPKVDFECKDYDKTMTIACEAKYLNKKSTAQVVCETSEKYGKTDKMLPLIHDDTALVRSYNDCVTSCDARQGCLGIDYNVQTNKCLFFGYETCKLEVTNSLNTNMYNIITYDSDLVMKEYKALRATFIEILDPAVSFKKIIIQTNSEFKGTVRLFDFENKLQKEFSNTNDDKDTNINHIERYETSPNVFELEFFYTDPEYFPEPDSDELLKAELEKQKEEADRKAKEKEEADRKAKEEAIRKAKEWLIY